MSSPTYLTCCCLFPQKVLWKLRRAFMTSRALARCALCSAALMFESLQISWDIQDACAFVGRGVLVISPLTSTKAASPLV